MDKNQLLARFLAEALTLAKQWEDSLMCISVSDHPEREINALLRIVHTLKGNCLMVELKDLTSSLHEIEEVLLTLRMNDEMNLQSLSLVSQGLEVIKKKLKQLEREVRHEKVEAKAENLKNFFHECEELVKNVASELNKEVHFHYNGEDIVLDSSFIQALSHPVFHIIRNAIDHGISKKGKLHLTAVMAQDRLILKVKDNGQGINKKSVFKKAHQKGIIPSKAKESDFTDEEIFQMIMLPGFSTHETPTFVSGRGLGLDAVKTQIEELGGEIEIKSGQQGTTFCLIIPHQNGKRKLVA